uniref:SnoaL-like domain-containing protein n=1 Tax=Solibacter usitatus (strain Ellin6076) TaxID=234267 RepID=Q01ZK2_SOLUE
MSPKIVLILFAAPLFSQTGAIEKAVLEVNAQMTQAAEARDIDRLFGFMLPNDRGSIAQSGFLFLTREDAQASVKRSFTAVQKIAYRWKHQMVTVISPDTAILVADGESEATFADGATVVSPFAQTVIFVRKDGAWKALHAHQSAPPRR